MTKQTIEWYKKCQKNFRKGINNNLSKIIELIKTIKEQEERYFFKQRQIEFAIKQGKKDFDDTKFLIPRKK